MSIEGMIFLFVMIVALAGCLYLYFTECNKIDTALKDAFEKQDEKEMK